ncbi:MAG: hypothetical protein KKC01_07720 [Gammaproteobacteria bacterium]|nr:hypothetical protein [Gammaproteobacteria bacterium]
MINNARKNKAIRSYLQQLPALLVKDYGMSELYTARQVRSTIERAGMNLEHATYALAMFADRESFDRHHAETGKQCDYNTLRNEVIDRFLDGNSTINAAKLYTVFAATGSGGEGACGADAGGGD